MRKRDEKLKDLIKEVAAKFLNIESNRVSMVTVTNVLISKDGKYATIFLRPTRATKKKPLWILPSAKSRIQGFRQEKHQSGKNSLL